MLNARGTCENHHYLAVIKVFSLPQKLYDYNRTCRDRRLSSVNPPPHATLFHHSLATTAVAEFRVIPF